MSRGAPAQAEGLPRTDRLRRRAEFLRVQGTGRRVSTPHFTLMVLAAPHQRVGVTVTKRTAGAVGRNRIKRLAREVFRRNRALFPANCEVVLVARSGADQLDYGALLGEIQNAQAALLRAAGHGRAAPPPTPST